MTLEFGKPDPASVNKEYNKALDLPWADAKYSIKTYIFNM
jgi:hypothetical protein